MSERELELVVTGTELVAKGVLRLTLAAPDGAPLPAWEPGAHIDLRFDAPGGRCVRQYSLCGDPADRSRWQVAVLLVPDGRGGSAHLHAAVTTGERLLVTGPRNNFPLRPAPRYLFVAGGIGITPLRPMLARVAAAGADWRLLYSGRSVDSMAFLDDVVALGPDRVRLHESDVDGVPDLAALVADTAPGTETYCCGPEPMLRAIESACAATAPPHVERFARREDTDAAPATAFEVEFARSGVVVTVPPERSVLELAEEVGVDIDSSCQQGTCGTCETAVLAGTPDHRDEVLSAAERAAGRTMMVCVSRSCSARLVLDA